MLDNICPDNAQTDSENDVLNFTPLAKQITKGILSYITKEETKSLILSIEGKWGSGKTTFINFIKQQLEADNNKEYDIFTFQPWLITNIEQIIKVFFDELTKVIIHNSKCSQGAKLNDIKKDLKTLVSIIAPDKVVISGGDIFQMEWDINNRLKEKEKILDEIKKDINTNLKELNKKIIIVIDDIDRLTDDETALIFRLVKGIADFDNIIYILLYDKEIVSKSLQKLKSEDGERYLEKIVQYPVTIPKATASVLEQYLIKELKEIDNTVSLNKETELPIIIKYIKNLRQIKQLINFLSFEFQVVKQDVNLRDFLIISIIKLQNYSLYEYIKNNSDKFFIPDNIYNDKEEYIEKIIQKLPEEYTSYKDLLKIIFPLLKEKKDIFGMESTLDGNINNIPNEKYYRKLCEKDTFSNNHKDRYICDSYYFDNYFTFSVCKSKISKEEFTKYNKILISPNNDDEFSSMLNDLKEKNKIKYFEDLYKESKGTLTQEENRNILLKLKTFFDFLNNVEDTLQEGIYYTSFLTVWFHAISDLDDNSDIFNNLYCNDFSYNEISFFKLLEEIKVRKIKEIENIKEKIKLKLEQLKFNDYKKYSNSHTDIYEQFEYFNASIEILQKEIMDNIFIEKNIFNVLELFKKKGYLYENEPRSTYAIYKTNLEKICSIEEVEKQLKKFKKDELTEEELILKEYFKNSFKTFSFNNDLKHGEVRLIT